MNNIQIELINKIVKESKKIESLKKELEQLQKDYYSDILCLYDSVDILGKEKEVAKTEIISMQDYKAKRLFRKQRLVIMLKNKKEEEMIARNTYYCPHCGASNFIPVTQKNHLCRYCNNLFDKEKCETLSERSIKTWFKMKIKREEMKKGK